MRIINTVVSVFWSLIAGVCYATTLISEGFSSSTPNMAAGVHYRAFTTTMREAMCESGDLATSLKVVPEAIILQKGDLWHPQSLVIRAYNKNGDYIPSVPVTISVDETEAIKVNVSENWIQAISAGSSSLVVGPACKNRSQVKLKTIVPIIVK
ncbi:hypothetical protein MO867_21450 [Microbulbifer sp. OS29]|uniref:Uncharacterized protein n=1 Tax=Microbulbifer okhotskensis TaxID=2926617 RepID=A0A9X2J6Q8_9GAMM|nr:hypothetical protein [Microbulbifer okhotskensis]MCO1336897.1 hypothetical protein [Microbulbifer okhotskensis]